MGRTRERGKGSAGAGGSPRSGVVWRAGVGGNHPSTVGQTRSSSASEWCQDDYADDDYAHSPAADPLDLDGVEIPGSMDSDERVRRGSWNSHTATMAAAARASGYSLRGDNHFGLRVAR